MVSDGLGWSGMGLDANNHEDNDDDILHQPTPHPHTPLVSPIRPSLGNRCTPLMIKRVRHICSVKEHFSNLLLLRTNLRKTPKPDQVCWQTSILNYNSQFIVLHIFSSLVVQERKLLALNQLRISFAPISIMHSITAKVLDQINKFEFNISSV